MGFLRSFHYKVVKLFFFKQGSSDFGTDHLVQSIIQVASTKINQKHTKTEKSVNIRWWFIFFGATNSYNIGSSTV